MADNFNLRSFLTENKLTRNAQLLKEEVSFNGRPVNTGSIEIDGIDTEDYPDFVDAYIAAAEYEDGTPLTDEELVDFQEENYDLVSQMIHDNQLYLQEKKEDSMEEGINLDNNPYTSHNFDGVAREVKKHKHLMAIANKLFPQYGGELENFKPLSREERGQVMSQYTDETRVAPVKESKLTAKEQALVEMVQAALGTEGYGDDNVNMQREKQGLQPQEGPTYSEAADDEMVKENPLPKYKTIDELMSNIEQGTNEAAHKYKMNRMKEVADALQVKVSSLEEGENAEHIDQKVVKQMRKDIVALRKAEEKLRKEFDKKFAAKKEAKEDK